MQSAPEARHPAFEAEATPAMQGQETGPVVRLVLFPPVWGRNVSPFGLKLETWLRLAGVPFDVRHSVNLAKAPKKKLPFIVDAGHEIGDSSLIVDHLKATRGIDPDAGLDRRARAEALALQRLFEDHFYFIMAYDRWLDPEGFAAVSQAFFAGLPAILRPAVARYFRHRVRRALWAQGVARHRPAEILDFARRDLDAIVACLADRPFFAGDQLTSIDAVAYGFLANVLDVPIETELKRLTQSYEPLVAWCETMQAGLYGEF